MRLIAFVFLVGFFLTQFPVLVFAEDFITYNPNLLITDAQMTDSSAMSKEEIQLLLSRGALNQTSTIDILGRQRSAAEIIMDASVQFRLNPQFLLVLLQKEQSLVEDNQVSQDQLDWAMGYAVCDACAKSDPGIQSFRGFGNQVFYAAKRLRESYLANLEDHGVTPSGIGPGKQTMIDGAVVVPANNATASLYTYTPHLFGNQNFVRIWNRWFSKNFPNGSLLQDKDSGMVWFLQNGKKRPITSKAALLSRFNTDNVIPVETQTMAKYPDGAPISFPNYSLLRSPKGTVYLIVDDVRRGFVSKEALRVSGFVPDEIVDVTLNDISSFAEGEPITTKTVYAAGALLQNKKTGGVYYIENGRKHGIFSKEILLSRFTSPMILAVSENNLESYQTSDPFTFPDGSLIGVRGSSDVFVVDNGLRRPITDAITFLTYGWKWDQIRWTNERSVLLQPIGEPISTQLNSEKLFIASELSQ